MATRTTDRGGTRGASETVGLVLLFALVILTAAGTVVVGEQVVTDAEEQSRAETGSILVKSFDARLGTIVSATGNGTTTLALGDKDPGEVRIANAGSLTVDVNDGTCRETVALSSLRYETDGGDEIAYQAGGVWRRDGDRSVMISPPDLTAQGGTLSISVTNVSGEIRSNRFRLRKDANASRAATREVRSALYQGSCRRPSNVTVSVTSDFYEAWGEYLRAEVGAPVSVRQSDRTVRFTLSSAQLPAVVDDSRNEVVDLQDPELVSPDPTNHRFDELNFSIDKSVGNTYFVSARPVADGTLVGDIDSFDGGTVYRRPIDVVLVVDESGSMAGSKIAEARDAAKEFVGLTNGSRDRIALVGYDTTSRFVLVDDQYYFSSDHDRLNDTIDEFGAGGGTAINRGLNSSLAVQSIESNASRNRHVILLTDGRNEPYGGCGASCRAAFDERTLDGARDAARQDIVVHTIGFGSNPDEDLLRDVANETGGTYSTASTGELEGVFADVFQNITETDQIVRQPVSTTFTVGGTRYVPQTADDADVITNDTGVPNVNDPSVSGGFSYALNTSDAAVMNVSGVLFDCADWELLPVQHTNPTTGEAFNEVRCTNVTGIDERVPPENATAYLDGADMSAFQSANETWWQPDLYNDTLAPYLNASGELDVESNQAIVVFEFPTTASAYGTPRLVMLYEFGLPDSTTTETVVDIDVTEVEIRD